MQNNTDPKYTRNVYNALKSKVEGFNKTESEFNEALKNPDYVKNVHNALKSKVEGFNKSIDEFSLLVTPQKKREFYIYIGWSKIGFGNSKWFFGFERIRE